MYPSNKGTSLNECQNLTKNHCTLLASTYAFFFSTKINEKNQGSMFSSFLYVFFLGARSTPSRKHQSLDPTLKHVLSKTEEEYTLQMRNMSPSSWISSPGTTPPTSPALTPRGTRYVTRGYIK